MPRLREPPNKEKPEPAVVAAADTPEVEVVQEPEQKIEVTTTPQEDDATEALRKQVESLKKSEQLWKERQEMALKERDEALQRGREREMQAHQSRQQAEDREELVVYATLQAAQASLAKAKQDKKNAIDAGDSEAQAAADVEIQSALIDMREAQRGKDAIEDRKKQPQPQPSQDVIDTWGMPDITTKWLKNHRHLLNDRRKVHELESYQYEAEDAGLTPHTQPWLEFIEVKLGERAPKEEPVVNTPAAPKPKGPIVSAPVSREAPSAGGGRVSNGKVQLTKEEQEAAQLSGISIEEYAKQKLKYQQMRASGEYGDQR